jgi:hypothetical protein
MAELVAERLQEIAERPLLSGGHGSLDEGMCVMEAVAYVAGEEWSDTPQCACPVLATFLRSWNDAITDDAHRTALLKPLVPRLVGSKSTIEVERRRSDMALDWLVRVHAPTWMDFGDNDMKASGADMRALPVLYTHEALLAAKPVLDAAAKKDAARAAAWAAAWDAAWDAARAAARAAAWAAAWDAARAAAGDAARAAAWDAAWAAARDAAWDAAMAAARAAAWAAARAAAWDAAMAAVWAASWAAARDAAWDAAEEVVTSGGSYDTAYRAAYDACAALFAPARGSLEASALELINQMLAVTPESLSSESHA